MMLSSPIWSTRCCGSPRPVSNQKVANQLLWKYSDGFF